MKRKVLRLARLLGVFALCRRLTRRQLRILCYHGIWIGEAPHFGDCLFMRPDTFAQRIALLGRAGYPVLGLDEALARLEHGTLPDAAVVITIDDAWLGTFRHMLPVLRQHGLPATLYVTTYYAIARRPVLNVLVGYLVSRAEQLPDLVSLGVEAREGARPRSNEAYARALVDHVESLPDLDARWEAIRRLAPRFGVDPDEIARGRWFDLMDEDELRQAHAAGIDIQLHTHSHRLHDFEPSKVRAEIERNRRHLGDILGRPATSFEHFCYPSGVYHSRVFDTLSEVGVRSATTTEFGLNPPGSHRYALKRILDCQSLSDIELEARLCGLWSILGGVKERCRSLVRR